MIVSVLLFLPVSVKTVFKRYVPLDRPVFVLDIASVFEYTVFAHSVPSYVLHIHRKPLLLEILLGNNFYYVRIAFDIAFTRLRNLTPSVAVLSPFQKMPHLSNGIFCVRIFINVDFPTPFGPSKP